MASFKTQLQDLINTHSREDDSDTPDFLLAEYLINCLENYELIVNKRSSFLGLPHDLYKKEV